MDRASLGQGDKVTRKIRVNHELMGWQNGMNAATAIFGKILSQLVVTVNPPERRTINMLQGGKR
jgi:hypothetical protein